MRTTIISKCTLFAALLFSYWGCSDELSPIENGVYIAEAAPDTRYNQQVETLVVEEDMIQTLNIRLVKYVDHDVVVTIGIDHDFLKSYNDANGTTYEVLPDDYLSFEQTVTIDAGEVMAPSIKVNLKTFDTPNGETYAVPLKIVSVTGASLSALGNANRILYLLASPHKQKTPKLRYANRSSTVTFNTPLVLSAWTVEFWLRINNPRNYNTSSQIGRIFYDNMAPVSFNEGNNSNILLRFWAIGALEQGPTLQNQMSGVYFDSSEFWQPETWYHIAYTFDGSLMQLYVNGVEDANKDVNISFTFNKMILVQNFSNNYQNEMQIAQIRLWSNCLQKSSIQDAMNRGVASDSPGLVGYWKCDEGEGSVLHDSSTSGNDLTISGTFTWSEEYNFSRPNE